MGLQEIPRLDALPPEASVAVIINCGTRVVSTLALASALRHAHRPVLLIDCESRDGSIPCFQAVAAEHGWEGFLLRWPLRPHGIALDQLFREIPARSVLLIDSDLEIRSDSIVNWMTAALAGDDRLYGAGFLNPSEELGPPRHLLPAGAGHFAERMWMPLTLLKVAPVRDIVECGESFLATREYREIAGWPGLSRLLFLRFRMPVLRRMPMARRPAFIDLDTGARVHRAALARGLRYAASDDWLAIRHFEGVTRAAVGGMLQEAAARLGMVAPKREANAEDEARERLREAYGIAIA